MDMASDSERTETDYELYENHSAIDRKKSSPPEENKHEEEKEEEVGASRVDAATTASDSDMETVVQFQESSQSVEDDEEEEWVDENLNSFASSLEPSQGYGAAQGANTEIANIFANERRVTKTRKKSVKSFAKQRRMTKAGKSRARIERYTEKTELATILQNFSSEILGGRAERGEMIKRFGSEMTAAGNERSEMIQRFGSEITAAGKDRNMIKAEINNMKSAWNASEFKKGFRGLYLKYLHAMFDGSTGNNCWCPVSLTDYLGRLRKLVVISIPAVDYFITHEVQHVVRENTTLGFFVNELRDDIPAVQDLNYIDEIKAFTKSGFRFLSPGRNLSGNRTLNRMRLIIVNADDFKILLSDSNTIMKDRMRNRSTKPGSKPLDYSQFGFDFGFKIGNQNVKEVKRIPRLNRDIVPLDSIRTLPVPGKPFVRETYTPFMREFFGLPSDMWGSRHVVCSEVDGDCMYGKVHSYSCAAERKGDLGGRALKRKARIS